MYIGVTGFMHPNDVLATLPLVPTGSIPYLGVGVLMSRKTIVGEAPEHPKRYPRREDVARIFSIDHRVLNLVHYNTSDQDELAAQLRGALSWGGPACDGLQLNIVWPDATVVRGLRISRPDIAIVLQINNGAMQACGNSAEMLAERVACDYGPNIDYVLVDASGGRGIPLNPLDALSYLLELDRVRDEYDLNFELAVAGGLSAKNLAQLLVPIRLLLPRFSIDAEAELRTDDNLDGDKVREYVNTAFDILSVKE